METPEPGLGDIVIYYAADGDDTPELVRYPLAAGQDAFAAIVARVHSRGVVDLMVVDPSRGPMPRWKVPYAAEGRPGHWTLKNGER
ncbi:MAG TPA: hypothetical protein VFO85_05275 [Vicinamibacteria bacterium]|nr:hypothetical protein [Vicinamibacteria bacterium]